MSSKYLPNSCRARKDRGQRDSRRNAFFLHLLNAAKKTLDISTTSLNLALEYLVKYFENREFHSVIANVQSRELVID